MGLVIYLFFNKVCFLIWLFLKLFNINVENLFIEFYFKVIVGIGKDILGIVIRI